MSRTTNSRTRGETAPTSRAQTNIDFVVGMSVFLLTVLFVVAFLPSVFEPFTDSNGGDALAADRTASLLAEQLLADPTTPAILDEPCTREFFDADGSTAGCSFDADAADLPAAVGVGSNTHVNVTVEEGGVVQSSDGVELRAGNEPSETNSVVVARRVVVLDDEEHDLFVRVW
ncbi:DUF7287 family protein [Halorussus halophilus]|uniref:DUF7287 family protein n=1 Tax=Halorussus halophilus TaxID=2650975 RepID=UPI0013018B1E|nr:hypothetical protein [Halorussus halophilus]